MEALAGLIDTFSLHGNDMALVGNGESLSYAHYARLTTALAAALKSTGIIPGDRVAFHPASAWNACLWIPALLTCKAVAMPINPRFPSSTVENVVHNTACDYWLETEEAPILSSTHRPTVITQNNFLPKHYQDSEVRAAADWPATLVLTSGSQGAPKAALHSLGNHWNNAWHSNLNLPLTSECRWLLSLPLFHVSGLGVLFRCWLAGAALALPRSDQTLLENIIQSNATHISLVPTQLHRLLSTPGACDALRRLRAILLGGAPAHESLINQAHDLNLPILPTYGLTEMASQVSTVRPGAGLQELLSAGEPIVPDSVRISDSGEILVGGCTRFLGYLQHDGLQEPFIDGFFPTGDLGRFDRHGCLHIHGRKDAMFMVGGENVHPEQIESRIKAIEGIEDAGVIGVPDPEYGCVPVAFLRGPQTLSEPAIKEHLARELPPFMLPRHFLPWPADLDSSLKISRVEMTKRAMDLLSPGKPNETGRKS